MHIIYMFIRILLYRPFKGRKAQCEADRSAAAMSVRHFATAAALIR